MGNNDETMKRNAELLQSIPAVGEKTAWLLLAYFGGGQRFKNGKEAASFVGLTPMRRQSGSSLNAVVGISKIGYSEVRAGLYAPAMNFACGRFKDREYAPFVKRLLSKGKPAKVVIVALMRKIVTIAFAVLKSQTTFDANKLG
ncbi:MAG: IS110 family transposase, partial [Neisseriaceae bacterium]|nr:IS110 family transposase [Neisseriaceae bacterium]